MENNLNVYLLQQAQEFYLVEEEMKEKLLTSAASSTQGSSWAVYLFGDHIPSSQPYPRRVARCPSPRLEATPQRHN